MFQKGPGEGYMEAKDQVLALVPNASCRLSSNGGVRHYRIFVGEEDVSCAAASSRDAWNRYLDRVTARAEVDEAAAQPGLP
ncbi:hypothetical protein [Defluviimonas salinarum]|uniref:Uncharacterized protein n=1 Tax=Defluviimonas salinarum TaxID=2992147 RepID=A0ABT3J5F1_9RHOB|nr:hypothetical protein [Defluviimonas salinarum]MCW3782895.1 hypothetical protein [Defluviimonas salinarum]